MLRVFGTPRFEIERIPLTRRVMGACPSEGPLERANGSAGRYFRSLRALQKAQNADLDLRILDFPLAASAEQIEGFHPESPGLGLVDGAVSTRRRVAPTIEG